MTVIELLGRLENLIERDPSFKTTPVEMMIEFQGKGQWQAPVEDMATVTGKYVVLIFEEPKTGRDGRE